MRVTSRWFTQYTRYHCSYFLLVFFLVSPTWVIGQAMNPVTRIRDIIYSKHDGVALTMDMLQPEKPNGYGIISVVSGGWVSSHDRIGTGEPFVDRGYTVFYVVHGSQPHFTVEEIIGDLHRAVRFIRSRANSFGINPDKLGITGSSAGGHLSLMMATRGGPGDPAAKDSVDRLSSAIQAAAVFYPPTDYLNWSSIGDTAVGIGKLAAYAAAFGPNAATPAGRLKVGINVSPIYGVKPGQAPVFIIHGDADQQVPVFQAFRFKKKCEELGDTCEVKVIPGAGHGGWPDIKKDSQLLADWFDRWLRGIGN